MSTTRFAMMIDHREQHGQAHHDRVVARVDRGDVVPADAGDVEDQLDHERARDDEAEQRPGGGDRPGSASYGARAARRRAGSAGPWPARSARSPAAASRASCRARAARRAPSARSRARSPAGSCAAMSTSRWSVTAPHFERDEVDHQRRDEEARHRVEDVREEHRRVVDRACCASAPRSSPAARRR